MQLDDSQGLPMTRRRFLHAAGALAASSALAACATSERPAMPYAAEPAPPPGIQPFGDLATMYGPMSDDGFDLPAIPYQKIDPQFVRQIVPDPTGAKPGTVVVDTSSHHLYVVRDGGMAIRYGVGLGRAGFEWQGDAVIQWKQHWPKWTPPDEMVARDPLLVPYSAAMGGMPGGLKNPLGARAMYLFQNGKDTLYRLHGSPEWWSIGKSVSSGCVRLINQDVIDLYDRVSNQTPVIVTAGLNGVVSDTMTAPVASDGYVDPALAPPAGHYTPARIEAAPSVSLTQQPAPGSKAL
jgi:lipoprotein-anchoring transpeptidase ErfK/SrfK